MSKKMLIDASHPEETRVVIVNGSRIEELDFESSSKRQLRGNVYLARVTRVEPSLQAAFVEYGGNRHGFLAFSEIHPDYYQIPYEDRIALLEAEEAENIAEDEDEDDETESEDEDNNEDEDSASENDSDDPDEEDSDDSDEDDSDEDVAAEQAKTAHSRRKRMSRRRYKIQEVIKRGQILLIQVVKEERGNKGAAMTTYLSLAGRYCVLMPNTPRGGGISRKIPNGADRKRLKSIVSEFDVPQGMGVIVRTAGAKRTKIEIKRDYDYLCRLWETTRETTLKSIAPALIHEEGNLVKRSIRDLYNKDINEVLVQGDEAYKTAKSFIKMLMPSHAKNVKAYKDEIPLFLRYQVERQIEDSLDSVVQLKSGGYLVIHPTEALVSVDVNSGRSTKERNVERTALKTNLEAADEVARQMRLRDLAGLVVIDFIDMDENRNNRAVEKRMKEALTKDRARVQASRISQFGLMEISRQRRRRSLLEGSTAHCEHCGGVGRKRTVESSALRAIRGVEDVGVRRKAKRIRLKVAPDVALYIFNEKRDLLTSVDSEFNVFTELVGDEELIRPAYEVEILENADSGDEDPMVEIEKELKKLDREVEQAKNAPKKRGRKKDNDDQDEDDNNDSASSETDDDEDQPKKRRRRGRRGGRRRKSENDANENDESDSKTSDDEQSNDASSDDEASQKPKRRRRKSKKSDADDNTDAKASNDDVVDSDTAQSEETEKEAKPRSTTRRKAPSRKSKPTEEDASSETEPSEAAKPTRKKKAPTRNSKASETEETSVDKPDDKPKSTTRRKAPARKSAKKSEPKANSTAAKKPEANESVSDTTASERKDEAPASDTPRSTTRRKAPARKAKTEKLETKPKRSKAKKSTVPSDNAAEVEEAPKSASKPSRSTARRKAPSRKKSPETSETSETSESSSNDDATESSTVAKAARKKDPVKTDMSNETPLSEDGAESEEKPQGKRSWWKRGKRK